MALGVTVLMSIAAAGFAIIDRQQAATPEAQARRELPVAATAMERDANSPRVVEVILANSVEVVEVYRGAAGSARQNVVVAWLATSTDAADERSYDIPWAEHVDTIRVVDLRN